MGDVNVKNANNQIRYDFGSATNQLDNDWTILSMGTGQSVAVAGSVATIAAGTTASAETILRCTKTFTVKTIVRFIVQLSQRIANQNVYLEVVNAAGTTYARWNIDGVTATSAKAESANQGTANTPVAVTIPTTASYNTFELYLDFDQCLHNCTVSNSNTVKGASTLFDRLIPQTGESYYAQIRVTNAVGAPATNTNVLVDAVLFEDLTMVGVEIMRAGGDVNSATALATYARGGTVDTVTNVTTLATVTTANTVSKNVHNADTAANLGSAATFTGTARDGGAVPLYNTFRTFVTADQLGTLYLEQSQDNVTWYIVTTQAVAVNTPLVLDMKWCLRYCRVRYLNGATIQTAFRLETSQIALGT